MRLLVLGGTVFVGKHIVEAALGLGHAVTIFHRGRTPASFGGPVEEVLGDRDSDLIDLRHQQWDAAIDVSGYVPRIVRRSATALENSVSHYTFVSTVSVYADAAAIGQDETAEVQRRQILTEEVTGETYGPLKVACEDVVREVWKDRALFVRPGLVAGPGDPTDRFTWWPRALADASARGEVLAPSGPDVPVQAIDVRDMAAWIVKMAAGRRSGTFNATGPAEPLTMGRLVEACREATRSIALPVWVPDEFLLRQQADVPLWAPAGHAGFMTFSNARARAEGLAIRPIGQTAADVWRWDRERGLPPLKAGLSAQRQAELLAAWKADSGGQQGAG